jgi:DNA-binding Lrp family transcriptional regulator
LLSQLSVGHKVVDLEAYCLLHLFVTGASPPPGPNDLSPEEIDQLTASARDWRAKSGGRSTATLHESDWPLLQALADDGRAPYRQLAARTHWHESTVRRRVEELVAAGVLSFDVDLAIDAVGFHSRALLWMSVVPAKLHQVGETLAGRPEIPFVAATTGSTNLLAALICRDDRSLYEYITGAMADLDGLTHIETAPVLRAVKLHATLAPSALAGPARHQGTAPGP